MVEAPSLPGFINPATHTFTTPQKTLVTPEDLEKFKTSPTFGEIITFIRDLQKSVERKTISEVPQIDILKPIDAVLEEINKYIDEIPPIQQPMRFGNKAFRTWYDKLKANYNHLIGIILKEGTPMANAGVEIKEYFLDCFGSYERIDYGTGHELNFLAILYTLYKIQYFPKTAFAPLICNTFASYIKLMRKLQLTYMLEPAGSHGVWGLDDYHFLPFVFGAAQLKDHVTYTPTSIHNEKILAQEGDQYLYFSCIKFIKEVKKGVPFYESSPMLNDISNVPSWNKVCQGMIKMYQVEVMSKHPVIKHLRFGSVLPFDPKK